MSKFLRKHKTILFVAMAIIFISLPFFGVGSNYLLSSPQDVVVKINGEKVKRKDYDRLLRQRLRQNPESTAEQRKQMNSEALNELVRITVFNQEAKKFKIHVPDQELRFIIEHTPAFQKDGRFDPPTYMRALTQVAETSPDEFEKFQRKDMAARKLNQLIASAVHVSDAELKDALPARLAIETDSKKKMELFKDPEKLRSEIQNQEINWVFQDWFGQINSKLKVLIVSERFKKSLSGDTQ